MLFVKKVFRDLWKNKSRSLPIIILIMVSQAAGFLYIEVAVMMNVSWQRYYQRTNVGDVWIDTIPLSSAEFNDSVVSQWQQSYSIDAVQPRLFFKGHITVHNEKIPVVITSLPFDPAPVNGIITADSSYFSDYPEFQNGTYIEQSYLEFYDIEDIEQVHLTVNLGSGSKNLNLSVLGGAYSPEYPMKPGEGSTQFSLSASFAQYLTMSLFVRTDYLQKELFQDKEIYNQICVSLSDESKVTAFIRHLQTDESALNRYTIDVRKYPALIEDMATIMIGVGLGVAVFFLFISVFITYTVVNRFIDEQRPQIGVLKALGYSDGYILTRNLYYGLILGLLGSIAGNSIGTILGVFLTDLTINSWISFPYIVIALPVTEFLLLVITTVTCSVLACYVAARRTLKISPLAAIRPAVAERRITAFFIERIVQDLFRFRLPVVTKYSIRNVFINRKRSLTTIFSLFMAVALVGGVLTIVDSVFAGNAALYESENWDIQITLTHPQSFPDVQVDILEKIPYYGSNITMEPILVDFAKIRDPEAVDSIWTKIVFTALPLNPSLKILENADTGFQNNTSAIISPDIAELLELEVGRSYSLLGQNGTERTVSIQAFFPSHYVSSFYIPLSLGNYLSFGNDTIQMANGVLLSNSELSKSDVEPLSNIPYVNSVILKTDMMKETENWYKTIRSVLFVLLAIILMIAGIIIYVIMSIGAIERKNDLVIMKAVGIHNRTIYLWGLLEPLIYSVLASQGYLVGFYISIWYMDILQSLMNQPQGAATLSLNHYILSFIFGLIAAVMGQFIALRYVMKQRIAVVTKEKMFA
ncbi:MAG: FtsX-like permease family protein [Candidatus Odinarchaeota archaeon]